MKIRKTPEGYEAIGEIDADTVDGKHASELKHGTAEDDQTAIKVKVGAFICPGSLGNFAISTIGFKPRYVEFRVVRSTTSGGQLGFGWMDYNGNQDSCAFCVISPEQGSHFTPNKCLLMIDQYSNYELHAYFVSMNSNGFTISFSKCNTGFTIQYKAIR